MTNNFDVIVIGLGGVGSAVAERLSRDGQRVLGLEQFEPVHDKGSTHGESRVIRKAYFENANYVPLLLRSYELWDDLEKQTNQKLLIKSGCLMMARPESPVIQGCVQAAKSADLPFELLDAKETTKRHSFCLPQDQVGFYEPDGGYLFVEQCIETFLKRAKDHGAELHFNTAVKKIETTKNEVTVTCDGKEFTAAKIIICAGAWSNKILKEFHLSLSPKRVVQYWFQAGRTRPDIPVYFQETPSGDWIYGFPTINGLNKTAFHNILSDCNPDAMNRNVDQSEVERIDTRVHELLPDLGGFSRAKTCIYNMTPDENFILGALKEPNDNVFVATGFSGHGFKFAPVIGEIASEFTNGKARKQIEFLSPQRFRIGDQNGEKAKRS